MNRSPNKPKSHDSEDAFVAGVLDASTWAKQNQSKLTAGIVVLVIVALGAWYWVNYSSSLEDRALVELEQIQNTLSLGDPETSKVALAQFLESFSGTRVAGEARLTLAQLYLETDQPGQALATLAASSVGLRDPMGPQLHTLRGRALEAQGRFDEAESVYMNVADAAELPFQRRQALTDAARMRVELGNLAGAIEIYDDLIAEFEITDPERGEYEMRKAELETELAG